MVCTVSLYLTLTGEQANAVLAVQWIASCISDPGPWANIHLHLSGVKFPSSTSLRSTSPALSHHLKSYSSATHCSSILTCARSSCLLWSVSCPSIQSLTHSTCGRMWLHLSIHHHQLIRMSSPEASVYFHSASFPLAKLCKNNDCFRASFPTLPPWLMQIVPNQTHTIGYCYVGMLKANRQINQ